MFLKLLNGLLTHVFLVFDVFFVAFDVFSLGPGSTILCIYGGFPPPKPGQQPGQKSDQKSGQKPGQNVLKHTGECPKIRPENLLKPVRKTG